MAEVSSMYARRMIEQAATGSEADRLLRLVGLDPSAQEDLQRFVSVEAYLGLLETIAHEVEGPLDFHVRMGASLRCDHMGVIGLAWKAAPTVAEAFVRWIRYSRLLVRGATYDLRLDGSHAYFTLARPEAQRLGLLLSNETAFVSTLSLLRDGTGVDITPSEVRYAHDALRSAPALEAHFGCPVRFGQPEGALVLERADLDRPHRVGDEAMHRFFETILDKEISEIAAQASLDARVRSEVAGCLTEGVPRIATVATRLHMSERTLQRRLRDLGVSYPTLVEATRRHLAEQLLLNTEHGLAEVAFLTGFSEHSAFTRAFKRWTGQAPSAFRRGVGD